MLRCVSRRLSARWPDVVVLRHACRRVAAKRAIPHPPITSHRSPASVLRMDLPQRGVVSLALDPPAGCWTILHGMTGERARLPGDGQRRWQLGFDDAGVAFVSCAEESVWCDELFSWRVVAANDASA